MLDSFLKSLSPTSRARMARLERSVRAMNDGELPEFDIQILNVKGNPLFSGKVESPDGTPETAARIANIPTGSNGMTGIARISGKSEALQEAVPEFYGDRDSWTFSLK